MNVSTRDRNNMLVFIYTQNRDLLIADGRVDAAIELERFEVTESMIGAAKGTIGNKGTVFVYAEIGTEETSVEQDQLLLTIRSETELDKWLSSKGLHTGF